MSKLIPQPQDPVEPSDNYGDVFTDGLSLNDKRKTYVMPKEAVRKLNIIPPSSGSGPIPPSSGSVSNNLNSEKLNISFIFILLVIGFILYE
jgi:hypothetical protein